MTSRHPGVLQVPEPQTADMAAEHFGAILPPDQLGGRVEMADAEIAIDDHHGLVRPLKRGQQEIRGFDHRGFTGVIACVHHPTLMPVETTEARPRWRGAIWRER